VKAHWEAATETETDGEGTSETRRRRQTQTRRVYVLLAAGADACRRPAVEAIANLDYSQATTLARNTARRGRRPARRRTAVTSNALLHRVSAAAPARQRHRGRFTATLRSPLSAPPRLGFTNARPL
jgi:hypothetical protein